MNETNNEAKPEFKRYNVVLSFQFPAWDEKDGIAYEEDARSKADAIKYARRQAEHDGHLPSVGKGRVTFKATEVISDIL